MTPPPQIDFQPVDLAAVAAAPGMVVAFADPDGTLDAAARKLNTLTRKAVARCVASPGFDKLATGDAVVLAYPAGLAAAAVLVIKLGRRPTVAEARRAGAAIAKESGREDDILVLGGSRPRAEEIAFGLALRSYRFDAHKSEPATPGAARRITFAVSKPEATAKAATPLAALAEGVYFTRDLTNEPANVLTTNDFAARLAGMQSLGLDIEILDEPDLEALGMRLLLSVGQGSASPSKVVVMRWNGADDPKAAPLALIGKGVVFDTGGISLKPGGGMEEMTMDMGGAGVVAGVMRTLALRQAKANVVGLVGLVENMPSGTATRPGDVVKSMKGDTVEIINTDAEGRLVLADLLWYAQERFAPAAMVNLATLTGAVIIALGHENTGLFANEDSLAGHILSAAGAEGEGAWRLPLGPGYDRLLKSRIADMKNIGGRPGGAITAAQFLQRFVKPEVPWAHLDIAGTARVKQATTLAPAGVTGWGVMTLNRLVAEKYER